MHVELPAREQEVIELVGLLFDVQAKKHYCTTLHWLLDCFGSWYPGWVTQDRLMVIPTHDARHPSGRLRIRSPHVTSRINSTVGIRSLRLPGSFQGSYKLVMSGSDVAVRLGFDGWPQPTVEIDGIRRPVYSAILDPATISLHCLENGRVHVP